MALSKKTFPISSVRWILLGSVMVATLISFSRYLHFQSHPRLTAPNAQSQILPLPSTPPIAPTDPIIPISSSYPISGWQVYNSRLGYRINYPSGWYAALDPAIADADVLYEDREFFQIRTGEVAPQRRIGQTPYFFIVIQQLNYRSLDLPLRASLDDVVRVLDGETTTLSEERFHTAASTGILRKREVRHDYSIQVVVLHGDFIYNIYSSPGSPQDVFRESIFRSVAGSLRF